MPTIFPYTDSPVKRKLHMMLLNMNKDKLLKGRVEGAQISNGPEYKTVKVMYLMMLCAQQVSVVVMEITVNKVKMLQQILKFNINEESANGDCDIDVKECQHCIEVQKVVTNISKSTTNCRKSVINISKRTQNCIITDDFLMDDVKAKHYTGLPSTCKLCFSKVPYGTNEAATKPWMHVKI